MSKLHQKVIVLQSYKIMSRSDVLPPEEYMFFCMHSFRQYIAVLLSCWPQDTISFTSSRHIKLQKAKYYKSIYFSGQEPIYVCQIYYQICMTFS